MEKRMLISAFIVMSVLLWIAFHLNNNVKKQIRPQLTTPQSVSPLFDTSRFFSLNAHDNQAQSFPVIEFPWRELDDTYEIESLRPNLHTPMMAIELIQASRFYLAHEGDEMQLLLPNANPLSIKVTHVDYLAENIRQWTAEAIDARLSATVVMTVDEHWLKGFIGTPDASYSLTLFDGRGWIYQEMRRSLADDQAYPNDF